MKYRIMASCLAALLMAAGCALAAPEPLSDSLNTVVATLAKPLPDDIRLGDMPLVLEETQLTAIQQALGKGKIVRSGDAGTSEARLCYTLPDRRIWLSSGEIHGSSQIDEVDESLLRPGASPAPDCPALNARLTFTPQLELGMDSTELTATLGVASGANDDWRVYAYQGTVQISGQPFDVEARTFIHLSKGKVDRIVVMKTTSS